MTPKQMEQQCKAMGLVQPTIEKVLETLRASGEAAALAKAKTFAAANKSTGGLGTESELTVQAPLVVLDDPVGKEAKKMTDLVAGQCLAGVAEVLGAIVK